MNLKELHTEVEINASPDAVWRVLTDFAKFPEWNPFILSATGEPSVGSKLNVLLQPQGAKQMTFKPRVLVNSKDCELRWLGILGFRGIFDGEHIFTLEAVDPGKTRFVQRELFSGLLVPLFAGKLDKNTRPGFEAMNQALKVRVEQIRKSGGTSPVTPAPSKAQS